MINTLNVAVAFPASLRPQLCAGRPPASPAAVPAVPGSELRTLEEDRPLPMGMGRLQAHGRGLPSPNDDDDNACWGASWTSKVL